MYQKWYKQIKKNNSILIIKFNKIPVFKNYLIPNNFFVAHSPKKFSNNSMSRGPIAKKKKSLISFGFKSNKVIYNFKLLNNSFYKYFIIFIISCSPISIFYNNNIKLNII